jgi:hypothetical protein
MDFVPIAFFHASRLGELRRFVSKPTPSRVVLVGRYAIMVVIRVPPR